MTADFREKLVDFVNQECYLVANQIGDAIARYGQVSAAELRQRGEPGLANVVEEFNAGAVEIARQFGKPPPGEEVRRDPA